MRANSFGLAFAVGSGHHRDGGSDSGGKVVVQVAVLYSSWNISCNYAADNKVVSGMGSNMAGKDGRTITSAATGRRSSSSCNMTQTLV